MWDTRFARSAVLVFVLTVVLASFVGAAPVSQEGTDYVVQPGETLALIAQQFLGDAELFDEIVSATNEKYASDPTYARIDDPAAIEVGWKLFIPGAPTKMAEDRAQDPALPGLEAVEVADEMGDIAQGKIAFSLYNLARESYEVQIVTADGKERWIVTDEEAVSEPALSPDGTRVAVRGWDRYRGIQTFDLYGKNQQGVSGHHEDSKPDWGAGGSIILGSQRESDRRWRLYENGSDGEIKFTNEHNLIESLIGEDPTWSRDGGYIAYRGCDFSLNRCGLRTVPRGGAIPQILTVESSDTSPDWSPDGRTLLFMSQRRGNWDLYTLALDERGTVVAGADPTPVTTDPSNEMLPVWSPWSDAVAFVSDRSGVWAVYIMRPDGSEVRKVADIGGTYDPPLWKPEVGGRGVTNEQISWSK
jgi:hypothetical protein